MYIFLYGTDIFRLNEKLNAIKNKYFEKNNSGASLSILDFGEEKISAKNLQEALSNNGLFSEKKLLIISNSMLLPTEKQKELLKTLKSNNNFSDDNDLIVVFFEKENPKKNLSLFKYIEKNSKSQKFDPLKGTKLEQWIIKYTKELNQNMQFSKNALGLLITFTGEDLFLLSNEIQKIVNYKESGIISENDIKKLVQSKINSTMFETIEALVNNNKSLAIKLFHQQILKGEDPYYILSMYAYQIRTLLKVGDFFWQGNTNQYQIASASGLHPYVVQKALFQLRNLTEEKVKLILKKLLEIDIQLKTTNTDPVLALDIFITSL